MRHDSYRTPSQRSMYPLVVVQSGLARGWCEAVGKQQAGAVVEAVRRLSEAGELQEDGPGEHYQRLYRSSSNQTGAARS